MNLQIREKYYTHNWGMKTAWVENVANTPIKKGFLSIAKNGLVNQSLSWVSIEPYFLSYQSDQLRESYAVVVFGPPLV